MLITDVWWNHIPSPTCLVTQRQLYGFWVYSSILLVCFDDIRTQRLMWSRTLVGTIYAHTCKCNMLEDCLHSFKQNPANQQSTYRQSINERSQLHVIAHCHSPSTSFHFRILTINQCPRYPHFQSFCMRHLLFLHRLEVLLNCQSIISHPCYYLIERELPSH